MRIDRLSLLASLSLGLLAAGALLVAPRPASAQRLPLRERLNLGAHLRLLPIRRAPRPLPEEGAPPRIRLPTWRQIRCAQPHAHNCMCEGLPGPPLPGGPLNLRRVLRRVQDCYENQLHGPSPRGRLEILLRVDAHGRTVSAQPTLDEIGAANGSACIARRLMALRFSPLPGSTGPIRELLQRFLFVEPEAPSGEPAPASE